MKKVTLTLNNRLNLGNYQHIDATVTFEEEVTDEITRAQFLKALTDDAVVGIGYALNENYEVLKALKQNVKDLPK